MLLLLQNPGHHCYHITSPSVIRAAHSRADSTQGHCSPVHVDTPKGLHLAPKTQYTRSQAEDVKLQDLHTHPSGRSQRPKSRRKIPVIVAQLFKMKVPYVYTAQCGLTSTHYHLECCLLADAKESAKQYQDFSTKGLRTADARGGQLKQYSLIQAGPAANQ
jgi:hypothetical protein